MMTGPSLSRVFLQQNGLQDLQLQAAKGWRFYPHPRLPRSSDIRLHMAVLDLTG